MADNDDDDRLHRTLLAPAAALVTLAMLMLVLFLVVLRPHPRRAEAQAVTAVTAREHTPPGPLKATATEQMDRRTAVSAFDADRRLGVAALDGGDVAALRLTDATSAPAYASTTHQVFEGVPLDCGVLGSVEPPRAWVLTSKSLDCLYLTADGNWFRYRRFEDAGGAGCVTATPDGRVVAVRAARWDDVTDTHRLDALPARGTLDPKSMAFDYAGTQYHADGAEGRLVAYNAGAGRLAAYRWLPELGQFGHVHTRDDLRPWSAAIASDGRVTVLDGHRLRLLDAGGQQAQHLHTYDRDGAARVRMSAPHGHVLLGVENGAGKLWRRGAGGRYVSAPGTEPRSLPAAHMLNTAHVAYSADKGGIMASGRHLYALQAS